MQYQLGFSSEYLWIFWVPQTCLVHVHAYFIFVPPKEKNSEGLNPSWRETNWCHHYKIVHSPNRSQSSKHRMKWSKDFFRFVRGCVVLHKPIRPTTPYALHIYPWIIPFRNFSVNSKRYCTFHEFNHNFFCWSCRLHGYFSKVRGFKMV